MSSLDFTDGTDCFAQRLQQRLGASVRHRHRCWGTALPLLNRLAHLVDSGRRHQPRARQLGEERAQSTSDGVTIVPAVQCSAVQRSAAPCPEPQCGRVPRGETSPLQKGIPIPACRRRRQHGEICSANR